MASLQISLALILFCNYILSGLAYPVTERVVRSRDYCLHHNAINPNMVQKLQEARFGVMDLHWIKNFSELAVESVADSSSDHCPNSIAGRMNSPHEKSRAACPW